MRKLLFAMSALAALFMIAPSNGFAQFDYQNMVGLYYDEADYTSHTATTAGGAPETVYMILTNPYFNIDAGEGESGTVPVPVVTALEVRVTAPATHFLVGFTAPVQANVIGTAPNYYVGYSAPVAVTSSVITLGWLTAFTDATEDAMYYLGPPTEGNEIEGHIAGVGRIGTEAEAFKMYPVSGSFDDPVFIFNPTGEIVATESETWSNVKALYR